MSRKKTHAAAPSPAPQDLHLVCGAGGSRAILGSAGAILACHLSGIEKWQTVGGASGGSIPALMVAGGVEPGKIVRFTMDVDFSSLLTRHASIVKILMAYFMKDRYEKTRPITGVMSSEKVGDFVEQFVPEWPDNFWTVAVAGNQQLIFTKHGVFSYADNGRSEKCRVISCEPAPVGLAIRATCAVPGIIDAVRYRKYWLFDGALSVDGQCPSHVVARHFGFDEKKIVSCDVGEDNNARNDRIQKLWSILCGSACVPENEEVDLSGTVLIRPTVTNFRSLQFTLSADQKIEAVMAGFMGGVDTLEAEGLLTGDRLEAARSISQAFIEMRKSPSLMDGGLAEATKALLASNGLYEL